MSPPEGPKTDNLHFPRKIRFARHARAIDEYRSVMRPQLARQFG
jgi:hypothetical protein